MDLSNKQKN